jgi:hypothetical protein
MDVTFGHGFCFWSRAWLKLWLLPFDGGPKPLPHLQSAVAAGCVEDVLTIEEDGGCDKMDQSWSMLWERGGEEELEQGGLKSRMVGWRATK